MSNDRWKPYRTDVLFLLVGTNPLPNYVAGCLLAKPEATIVLLATQKTHKIAKRLQRILEQRSEKWGNEWEVPEPREIDEADESKIYRSVSELVKEMTDSKSIGLNYTGGTKAMAVHAYRAVEDSYPDAVFSYLDANELTMRIQRRDIPAKPIPVQTDCTITFEELIRLHSQKLKSSLKRVPIFPNVARALAKRFQGDEDFTKQWREWCNHQFRDKNGNWHKNSRLRKVEIPSGSNLSAIFELFPVKGVSTIGELASELKLSLNLEKWNAEKMAKWLDGLWLEHYVLDAFQAIAKDVTLHDTAMSFNVDREEAQFEFDVAALRGYQLFAVSCTTSAQKGLSKGKLFEAYLRSHQMGGDEAHTALVSMYPDPQKLKRELEESWHTQGHIEVFGPQDLLNLSDYLREWIKKASHM